MSGTTAATSPVAEIEPAATDPAITADLAAASDANPATSSSADETDAKEPVDLLSITRSVLEKKEPVEPVASSDPESDPAAEPPIVDPAAVVEPDATQDDADLPFHNHPRWKAVIAERDTLKDSAERFDVIESFRQEHHLTVDEVADGYSIMAALKSGDPVKLNEAREYFATTLAALDEQLGNVLPEDLQARVDEGLLDEDGAQELARSRATTALRTSQETARTEAEQAATARREAEAVSTAMVTAVDAWEGRMKSSDPDYSKKASLVQDKCLAIVSRTGKAPAKPEEATALADQALAEVNAVLKAALPKPRAIAPTPIGSSATALAAPTSPRGITEAALARA